MATAHFESFVATGLLQPRVAIGFLVSRQGSLARRTTWPGCVR